MTIETRYNIGDEVWVKWEGWIYRTKIDGITIDTFYKNDDKILKTSIRYDMEIPGVYLSYRERAVFPTKEELLKSL
jgi:hypothetical protein